MKLLKISNTNIGTCPLILGVVLFLLMTPILHSEITNFKYVISDHLGTAKMLIDEEGNVIWPIIRTVESNELLPFGGELDVFQSESRYNLNFTNKELDRVLDLHYFGARYYQANIGRFLSPDPVGGNPADPLSWNKYLYCHNDPVNYFDPDGQDEMTDNHCDFFSANYKLSDYGREIRQSGKEVISLIVEVNGQLSLFNCPTETNEKYTQKCSYSGPGKIVASIHTHPDSGIGRPSLDADIPGKNNSDEEAAKKFPVYVISNNGKLDDQGRKPVVMKIDSNGNISNEAFDDYLKDCLKEMNKGGLVKNDISHKTDTD